LKHNHSRLEPAPADDSLSLHELLVLARKLASGALGVDRRRMRIIVGPCPECKAYMAHIHTPEVSPEVILKLSGLEKRFKQILYRTLIVVECYTLFLPRRLQEWVIAHEVAHLHCVKDSHNSKKFVTIEHKLMPDINERYHEYYKYLKNHRSQLSSLVQELSHIRAPPSTTVFLLRQRRKQRAKHVVR